MKRMLLFIAFYGFGFLFVQAQTEVEQILWKAYYSPDSSDYYFKDALKKSKDKNDSSDYFYFKFFKALISETQDSLEYYSNKTIPLLKDLEKKHHLRNLYQEIGLLKRNRGQYEEALKYAHHALSLAEELKDTLSISNHLAAISFIYHDFEHFQKGVYYGKSAYKVLPPDFEGATIFLVQANNAIAINFDDWNKPDSALVYHFKNLKIVEHHPDSIDFAFVYNNIGNTLLKQKKYKEAKPFLLKSLRLNLADQSAELYNKNYGLATNYTNLATIAYQTGRLMEAEEYFKSAIEHADLIGSIEKKRDIIREQIKFYKKYGNFQKALVLQEEFQVLRDSVFSVERAKLVAELEAKYQIEKKERLILEQENLLIQKDYKMRKKNFFLYGSISLAVLFAFIGYLLYNRQILKNKQLQRESELNASLAKIETQNKLHEERIRISRDLHDNIGAKLTFIISSLDNLPYVFKEIPFNLNDKLLSISRFTSETIYELRDTIWAMNKVSITFEDLQGRITNFIEKAQESDSNIVFKFEVDPEVNQDHEFSSVKGMHIYRIIQEAVHNAIKHADAQIIKVLILKEEFDFKIEVIDDGKGFENRENRQNMGLLNMKKRALELKAGLEIISQTGMGTRIILKQNLN